MRKILTILFIFFVLVIFFSKQIFAESTYVLPYPSFMPGTAFYKIHVIWEKLMHYWYFGSFAQYEYNLSEADKYLIEAKTLYEYKQFLLAYYALEQSNYYFSKISGNLNSAEKENKDISQKTNIFKQAALKHIEILESLDHSIPYEFTWNAENSIPIILNNGTLINESIAIRNKAL